MNEGSEGKLQKQYQSVESGRVTECDTARLERDEEGELKAMVEARYERM